MEQNDNHKALVLIIGLSIQYIKTLRNHKLMEHEKYGPIIKSIFSYYKYFSQYEHFSEHAHGDTLAPFYQDNVSFPAALKALNRGVKTILEQVDLRFKDS